MLIRSALAVALSLAGAGALIAAPVPRGAGQPPADPVGAAVFGVSLLDGHGTLVLSVAPGGAACRAGLHGGERLLTVGGTPIESFHDLKLVLAQYRPGAVVPVKVRREGGATVTLAVRLGDSTEP